MIATIDFETTGLKAGEDEVLQVSIIDENYNVLLNAYCRPNNKDSWEDAQAVHGITPLMVANELPFERYVPTVLDILSNGLMAEEKILGGRVEFLEEENTTADLLAGKAKFHIYLTPPSPAKELDFVLEYDVSYLENIFA